MRACGPRSKQITHQLGPAVSAGKVRCFRLCTCIGGNKASGTGKDDCRASDKTEKFSPPHIGPLLVTKYQGVRNHQAGVDQLRSEARF
jgi:hypothetical protein